MFKRKKVNPELEQAYNRFRLPFEIQALRITCLFGILHVFLFLVLDYWRATSYFYVIAFRGSSILVLGAIVLLTFRRKASASFYNALCVFLCSILPILFYFLDFYAGMPNFFIPNSMVLFIYVFNVGLGHSFKLKIIHTSAFVFSFAGYAHYLSPDPAFSISQLWNLVSNASISLLLGYLITQFKRLNFIQQDQLSQSNLKLDLALNSVEMGAWSWNIKTNRRTFDQQTCKLLGIDYDTFDGSAETFMNAIHPDDRDSVKKVIAEAIENRKSTILPEYRVVWPDGTIHFMKGRGKLIYDAEGKPHKLDGIGWDVTDQKIIEQEINAQAIALKESESKFRQISETINDVFYLFTINEKRYEFISKNCLEVLGVDQNFFYGGGNYASSFVHPDDQRLLYQTNELSHSTTFHEIEFRIIRNGEIKWIREKIFPIKDELGNTIKNSGVYTDISHMKTQEMQLLEQKQNLEKLNNAKDKFFSIVAHDLKSPLNSLKAFTSLLIKHTDAFTKEQIKETSRQAQASVDNTIKMADNLITWARLQMNDYETKKEVSLVKQIIADIIPVYADVAAKKNIKISSSLDDTTMVWGDKNQISFIIRNLIDNAIKFTRENGLVKLETKSLPNNQILISVKDDGIGIPDEMKQKLFGLNKGTSTTGTAGEKGTGLGMMLCHEFALKNNGTIEVESEEGRGTTFYVKLPQEKDQK